MSRLLLVVSGGVESSVLMALAAQKQSTKVHALFFDYGQKTVDQEEAAIERLSRLYGIHWERAVLELPWMKEHLLGDAAQFALASKSRIRKNNSAHIVEYRNLAFLGVAANYAAVLGATRIWAGFDYVSGRSGCAADKSPAFVGAFNRTLQVSKRGRVPKVEAPLQGNSKAKTIRKGLSLKVPFIQTWSCYNEGVFHCGRCGSCVSRIQGFEELGLKDPVMGLAGEETELWLGLLL